MDSYRECHYVVEEVVCNDKNTLNMSTKLWNFSFEQCCYYKSYDGWFLERTCLLLYGLSITGKKAELIERLKKSLLIKFPCILSITQ